MALKKVNSGVKPYDRGIHIPSALFVDNRVTQHDILVVSALLFFRDLCECKHPSIKQISEVSKVSHPTVRISINRLIELGYLVVENRGERKSREYTVLDRTLRPYAVGDLNTKYIKGI